MKREATSILLAVVLACLTMAMVETVFQPGYVIKSAVKPVLFVGTILMFGGKGLFRWAGLLRLRAADVRHVSCKSIRAEKGSPDPRYGPAMNSRA